MIGSGWAAVLSSLETWLETADSLPGLDAMPSMPVLLIGHSMGGVTAAWAAMQRRESGGEAEANRRAAEVRMPIAAAVSSSNSNRVVAIG